MWGLSDQLARHGCNCCFFFWGGGADMLAAECECPYVHSVSDQIEAFPLQQAMHTYPSLLTSKGLVYNGHIAPLQWPDRSIPITVGGDIPV